MEAPTEQDGTATTALATEQYGAMEEQDGTATTALATEQYGAMEEQDGTATTALATEQYGAMEEQDGVATTALATEQYGAMEEQDRVATTAFATEQDGSMEEKDGDSATVVVEATADDVDVPKRRRRAFGAVPRWTKEEDEKLRALVEEQGGNVKQWKDIADKMSALFSNSRTPGACDQHWAILSGKRKKNASTKVKADEVTPSQAQGETMEIIVEGEEDTTDPKPKVKRERRSLSKAQRWTEEEETKLKELVEKFGTHGSWAQIAEELGTGRTGGGVDQHYQIMTGKRKLPPKELKIKSTPDIAEPIVVATEVHDAHEDDEPSADI